MNKLRKTIIGSILFILIILVNTNVFAISGFDFWIDTPDGGNVEGVEAYASFSKAIDGITYQIYCSKKGGYLSADDFVGYQGKIVNDTNDNTDNFQDGSYPQIEKRTKATCSQCSECGLVHKNPCDSEDDTHGYLKATLVSDNKLWEGEKVNIRYSFDKQLVVEDYQDLAYILSATDENGAMYPHREYYQYYIWASLLNEQNGGNSTKSDYGLEESVAYQQFYEAIHDGAGNDTYEETVEDITNYDKVKVSVDRTDQTYKVGPFKIKYLDKTDLSYGPYTARLGYDSNTNNIYDYTNVNSKLSESKAYKKSETNYQGQRVDFNKITQIKLYDQNGNEIKNTKIIREKSEYDKDPDYAFPKSQEEFWIEFPYKGNEKVTSVTMKVKFEYLEKCFAEMYEFKGTKNLWEWKEVKSVTENCHIDTVFDKWNEDEDGNTIGHDDKDEMRQHTLVTWGLYKEQASSPTQELLAVSPNSSRSIKNYELEMKTDGIAVTMQLGGFVFLDAKTGKASQVNDILDKDISVDQLMEGIEVSIYECKEGSANGKLANLVQEYEEVKKGSNEYNRILAKGTEIRTNPTLTDSNGQYIFKGLNAMKTYYVEFTYNGQIYTSSKYKATGQWEVTSKATEGNNNRQEFNNQFAEIGSYPCNYEIVGDVLYPEAMTRQNGQYYNIAFKYNDESNDADTIAMITETIAELIQEYIDKSPKSDSMGRASYPDVRKEIYPQVLKIYRDDPYIKNKIQFIEDCKIKSYTGSNGKDNLDLYPRYDQFVIDSKYLNLTQHEIITADRQTGKVTQAKSYNTSFTPIYPEQFYINQGIKLRPTVDLSLYKDVFQARVTINGMEEIYKYNKRAQKGREFELVLRYGDVYNNYTNPEPEVLTDEILKVRYRDVKVNSDNINSSGYAGNYHLTDDEKLHIWVTYKLAIENQSATTSAVTELVDYFDKMYEFTTAFLGDDSGNKIADVTARNYSKYGDASEIDSSKYNTVYLEVPEYRIDNNERAYVYVTLELTNAPDKLSDVVGNDETSAGGKLYTANLAEINGYKTFYSKSNGQTPGLIDIDSKPGTLVADNYVAGQTPLEDDEDQAPAYVYVKRVDERTYSGTVFEDSTPNSDKVTTAEYREGSGMLEQGENLINGVYVELIEIKNGKQEVRAANYTDAQGNYKFNHYLAGHYIVRYTYGREDKTVLTKEFGGLNDNSYNGQDYQSTKIASSLYEYNEAEDVLSVKGVENPKYWYAYDIGSRYSDAIDKYGNGSEIGTRSYVIEYSKNMDNYKTRVLTSFEYGKASGNEELLKELMEKVYMTAYTPYTILEIEKATPQIDSAVANASKDVYDYDVINVDFGIVERPRSVVQVKKEIENVTIKTQEGEDYIVNGNLNEFASGNVTGVQAIKTQSTIARDLLKLPEAGYNKQPYKQGFVNIILDEERMRGATIEITYKVTLTNLSELDYVKGNYGEKYKISSNRVTTQVNKIIDYVHNNLKVDTTVNPNTEWKEVIKPSEDPSIINSDKTKTTVLYESDEFRKGSYEEYLEYTREKLTHFNSLAVTTARSNEALLPQATGTPINLKLTQVLTQTADSDSFVYENNLEIVETSNTVGRRAYIEKSVLGNFNPETRPDEPDSGETEKIIITPPTGEPNYIPLIAYIGTMLVILGAGIVVIRKIVLGK